MAIVIDSIPANGILTTDNRLPFVFSLPVTGDAVVQIKVTDLSSTELGRTKFIPFDSSDVVTIFLEGILQTQFTNDDNTSNDRNPTGGLTTASANTFNDLAFNLEYRTSETAFIPIGTDYGYWKAIRNIQDYIQGTKVLNPDTNLAEFNAVEASGGGVGTQGKYLTKLSRRKLYWYSDRPQPASASDIAVFQQQNSFQWTDVFSGTMNYRVTFYDGNDVAQSTSTYAVASDKPKRGLHPVWRAQDCYPYQYAIIDITSSGGGTMVSQRFDIVRLCNNPTVIKYINAFGTWETFAFEGRTPRSNNYSSVGRYGTYPTISSSISTGRDLRKRQETTVDVSGEGLSLEEAIALEDLPSSPTVLLYVGDFTAGADTDEWVECRVDPSSYDSYDTYNSLHKVSFTLELNETLTLRN